MTEGAWDSQAEALRTFTVLTSLRPSATDGGWPGALILAIGLGPRGAAVSLAGNIAGAACLAAGWWAFLRLGCTSRALPAHP